MGRIMTTTRRMSTTVMYGFDSVPGHKVSSTDCYFDEGLLAFGAPSGRLLVYDPIKQKSEVLQEEIHLANGIILSPNEDYVIFAESFQYRLLKHWIEGPKKGK